jgi:perosamine synthetase
VKPARAIPPAAAPLSARDLVRGVHAQFRAETGAIEEAIRKYFGCESAFLVSSGKTALSVTLRALHALRPRNKVLIPAYTCYSVPSAILNAGLEIALCDVEPDTLDFDYLQLERIADETTLCILPTHLFGIAADVERVRRICAEKGIFLVEDAAQAMGVEHGGRLLGTLGDAGFFSLGRGKNITCGHGGIIVTSSPEIAAGIERCLRKLTEEPAGMVLREMIEVALTTLFLSPALYWLPSGLPFLGIGETTFDPGFRTSRLGGFGKGVLRTWKQKIDEYNSCRMRIGRQYVEALELRNGWAIHSRPVPYLRFPIYATTPHAKIEACARYVSLGVSAMYPGPVHRIEALRGYFRESGYPGAEWVADRLMTLPTHTLMNERDRVRVCDAVARCCDRKERMPRPVRGAV